MLQFIVGLVIGGFVGFCVCAVISINNTDKDKNIPTPDGKKLGESSTSHE